MDSVEHYQAFFKTGEGQLFPWLEALRAPARERFLAHGFPDPLEEGWRYTPLRSLERVRFTPAETMSGVPTEPVDLELLKDAYSVVFVDGHFVATASCLEGLPEEVKLKPLSLALRTPGEDLQGLFEDTAAAASCHRLEDFNTALFSDGLCLDIQPNYRLEKPIVVVHLTQQAQGLNTLQHRLRLAKGAEAHLIEVFIGPNDHPSLTTSMTYAVMDENASLRHVRLQREGKASHHFSGLRLKLKRSARYRGHLASLGALWSRTEIHAQLGSSAECELEGLLLASGRQHQDIETRLDHCGTHASSRQNFRGIANDHGRGVFTGRIVVDPGAEKTDAGMSIRNLLLSGDAEIDARPQLEIHADDVKCSHGVTVGQLDEEAVFTLQSRGIGEEEARHILTFAFANELIERIDPEGARAAIRDAFKATLPGSDFGSEF